jgi:catechol 2,3-dioxygenase-like lactoylglutathione lyase family enzyme
VTAGVVTGCDHIGISVADVERSTRFYETHLGFRRLARSSRNEAYVQKVVGYHPDVTLEIQMLEIPGTNVQLEILEYRDVDKTPAVTKNANPGTAHFCLFVEDLEAMYERLASHGVGFDSEVQTSDSGPIEGGKVVYMIDPDGIRVELVELPKEA